MRDGLEATVSASGNKDKIEKQIEDRKNQATPQGYMNQLGLTRSCSCCAATWTAGCGDFEPASVSSHMAALSALLLIAAPPCGLSRDTVCQFRPFHHQWLRRRPLLAFQWLHCIWRRYRWRGGGVTGKAEE